MILSRSRQFLPLAMILAGAALFYAIGAAFLANAAHADPVAAAAAASDASWSLVTQYGPLWGGGLLLFSLGGSLLRANASTHWIAQGRALALLTGALSVLGALAQWHFSGAPAAGIVATLVAAVSLVLHPTTMQTGGAS